MEIRLLERDTELDLLWEDPGVLASFGLSALGRLLARKGDANPAGLTDRQVEVLTLLAEGLTNAQIADRLADARDSTGRRCDGRPSFDAAARRYVASFALSCLAARQMRVLARIDSDLDLDPDNHYAGAAVDFAPDQPNWGFGAVTWSGPAVRVGVRADRPAAFRSGTWYLRSGVGATDRTIATFTFGRAGDLPVLCDWNGDGYDQPGLFRAGRWQLLDTFWALVDPDDGRIFWYGQSGDVPVVGDWNRDGVTTVGVRRGTRWYVSNALGAPTSSSFSYGLSTDRPVIWR